MHLKKNCLAIAHRGASSLEPENTLRAFSKAHELGADGIELDIHITKDQHLVVTHDQNTKRITGENKNIWTSSLKELKALDFGKKEQIPTLSETLDAFLNKFFIINIEIKSTGLKNLGVEDRLAAMLKRFRCENRILVSSFNPINLFRFKRLMPNVRCGYLLCQEQNLVFKNRFIISVLKPSTLNLDQNLFRYSKHKGLFSCNLPKWMWTVNEPQDMEFWLQRTDVEAIITNQPDRLIKLLRQARGRS